MAEKTSKDRNSRGQFTKGRTKTGGRTKNTPNKKTLQVREIVENRGINVVGELLDTALNTENEELKVQIFIKLLPYLYPQFKAIECNISAVGNSMAEFMRGLAKVKK